jgi:hypothetical protein
VNLHDEFNGICDELEAGVVNRKRINVFLRWTQEQGYSLYRRRFADSVEINPVKDAIVVRLSGLANGKKFDAVESASLLRKQFALLNAPVVDDELEQSQDAIEAVRKIVNKVRILKRPSQQEKGKKIAEQVGEELWQSYRAARKLKNDDAVEHFTRLIKDCAVPKGVPQWLKG